MAACSSIPMVRPVYTLVNSTALAEKVRRLVETYRPERINLFGSVARGDASPDNDYDIIVVLPDEASRETQGCDLVGVDTALADLDFWEFDFKNDAISGLSSCQKGLLGIRWKRVGLLPCKSFKMSLIIKRKTSTAAQRNSRGWPESR